MTIAPFAELYHIRDNSPPPSQDNDRLESNQSKEVTAYKGYEISNYPGASNIFYIPSDIYSTGRALVEGVRNGDHEEVFDSSVRLFGVPANILSTAGMIASYGASLGIIASLPVFVVPVTATAGTILCIIEGIVDIFSLRRQNQFESQFDFELLSHLRNMLVDFKLNKAMAAVKGMAKLINKDPTAIEKLLGKDQAQIAKNLLNKIHGEVKKNPKQLKKILDNHRPALEEVAKHLLVANLEEIQNSYLMLSPEEKREIERQVQGENPELEGEKLRDLQTEKLQTALMVKQKKLSRRVCSWMVTEANKTVKPLLRGVIDNNPNAIEHGLNLVNDMRIQSKKKRLAHILGIVSLTFAAAFVITTALIVTVGISASIPYILAGVAMTFALIRAGIFFGMLGERGWTLEPKKLLPSCIRKRIFSDPRSIPEISHQCQRSSWIKMEYNQRLNLNAKDFDQSQAKPTCPAPRWLSV